MEFFAKAKFVHYSPYKLRLLADVIRGKNVPYAIGWLSTYKTRRTMPIKKILESAVANAKNLKNIDAGNLFVKEIRVDHGPMFRYYKPGAMGRSNPQTKRLSHISIVLEDKK
jgi:large subunit ribosomal protein L22